MLCYKRIISDFLLDLCWVITRGLGWFVWITESCRIMILVWMYPNESDMQTWPSLQKPPQWISFTFPAVNDADEKSWDLRVTASPYLVADGVQRRVQLKRFVRWIDFPGDDNGVAMLSWIVHLIAKMSFWGWKNDALNTHAEIWCQEEYESRIANFNSMQMTEEMYAWYIIYCDIWDIQYHPKGNTKHGIIGSNNMQSRMLHWNGCMWSGEMWCNILADKKWALSRLSRFWMPF